MTQIDFYVLSASSYEAQQHFCCRLIEKAVNQGNTVLVNVPDEVNAAGLDSALWTFRPESFIPHFIAGSPHASNKDPVAISHGGDVDSYNELLVNLSLEVPQQFSRFARLAEIVIQEPKALENSRRSYAFYKKRGYPINTHKLK